MSDYKPDPLRVYESIREYCETYNIPIENLLDILEDQKVVPMIRGKATEYIGAIVLRKTLPGREWNVEKLNLNPQSESQHDEDISVTFRRTGQRFRVETKNAVRGSFKTGTKIRPNPHFAVKCHRSRSHITRKRNDRYLATDFDLLLCNVSNAVFRNKAMEPGLPLIENQQSIEWLKQFYGAGTDAQIRRNTYDDWRFCLPSDIAENGIIPRTPKVLMHNDPNWHKLEDLQDCLLRLVRRSAK